MCYVPSQQNVLKNALIKIVMPVCPSAWQHVVTYVLTVFSLSVIKDSYQKICERAPVSFKISRH